MLSLPLSTRPELAFNWATLTASVSASPAATLEILLPPLSKPSLVRLTASLPLLGTGVRVMPFAVVSAILPSLSAKETLPPLMVVTLPSVSNCALFKPCKSLASLTLSVPLRSSETTPMLLSDSFAASAPPLTKTWLPSLRSKFLSALSPPKARPFCSSVPMLSNAPCTVLTGAACVPSVLVTTRFGTSTAPVVGLTVAPNAVANGVSWLTLTASVLFTPAAMSVAFLPPLDRPSVVSLTGFAAVPTVTPSAETVVLPPAASMNSDEVRPFSSFANLTLSVPLASSETTPMLLADSLASSASPPLTVTVLPN